MHVQSCFLLIRNKSVRHVQSFFMLIRKKCAARAKFVFCLLDLCLLFFTVLVVFIPSLVIVFRITRFYIFFDETISIKESFAFSPG